MQDMPQQPADDQNQGDNMPAGDEPTPAEGGDTPAEGGDQHQM